MRPREIVRPKTVQYAPKLAKTDAEMYETRCPRQTTSTRPARQMSGHLPKPPCVSRFAMVVSIYVLRL